MEREDIAYGTGSPYNWIYSATSNCHILLSACCCRIPNMAVLQIYIVSFIYFFYKYDHFCVTKIKYVIYSVQDYNIPCSNGVRMVKCEGWHFTHMWKALA